MKQTLIIILFSLFWGFTALGQNFVSTEVNVSTEIIKYNNQNFYAHKVLEKQTLYSICKAYNVDQAAIIEHNPILENGLKAGIILKIPFTAPSTEQKQKQEYQKYRIKWYENLNSVARKFDTSVEAIMDLNQLKSSSVQKRSILLIPDRNYIIKHTSETIEEKDFDNQDSDSETPAQDSVTISDTNIDSLNQARMRSFYYEKSINSDIAVSLILPFDINITDSTAKMNLNMMDFYSGTLLAVKEITDSFPNIDIKLKVSDINDPKYLFNSKLIIGPINAPDMSPLAAYAKQNKIPIVSPLDIKTRDLGLNNPYFFLFPPSPSHTSEAVLKRINTQDSTKVSILFENGTDSTELVLKTKRKLTEMGLTYDTFSYSVIEGRDIYPKLQQILDKERMNSVVIASENEAFVTDAMRNLYFMNVTDNLKIEAYGQPKWKNYESIELEYYHILGLNINTNYHVDYNNQLTNNFIRNFKDAFNTEPSAFAYQGYDIARYFINALIKYDLAFPNHLNEYSIDLTQSNVKFVPISPEGGFENIGTKAIKYYSDWSVKEL